MRLVDAMRGAEQELRLSLRVLVRMARPCLAHMTPGLGVMPAARRGASYARIVSIADWCGGFLSLSLRAASDPNLCG